MDSMVPKERLKHLSDKGGNVSVDKNVPIQRYFRSGQEMMRMANVYYEEKEYEAAFLLFTKFITLFLVKLKNHPQYKQASTSARAANRTSLKTALDRAEKIKSILNEMYEMEFMKWKAEQDKLEAIKQQRLDYERRAKEEQRKIEEELALAEEKQQLDYFVEKQRRKDLEEERLAILAKFSDATDLNKDEGPLIPVDFAPPPSLPPSSVTPPGSTSISPPSQATRLPPPPSINRSAKPLHLVQPKDVPASNHITPAQKNEVLIPGLYAGEAISSTVSVSKNKYGLRTVLSPRELPDKFMQYARSNTAQNIETCGVLFGNLSQNMFVITHVLLPHQCGTSESCSTTREEDMWEFQDHYDGICLGWIHTHPSQTAFLSSVDLHTHYPYQCLMAESVAIVCSGKFKETGYFMITPGQGMKDIGNCSKTGHHPHQTNPPLFETCCHVQVSDQHRVEFVDWRRR